MKYKEFERKLKELDFYAGFDNDSKEMYIYTPPRMALAVINDSIQYDVFFSGKCKFLNSEERKEFFELALEYASTPVDERREKKYNVIACRLKRGNPENILEDVKYYYRGYNGWLSVSSDIANDDRDQQWTLKQIEQYGLEGCERVEI